MKIPRSSLIIALLVGSVSAMLAWIPGIVSLEQEIGLRWLSQLRGPVAPPHEVIVITMSGRAATNILLPRAAEQFHRCEDIRIGNGSPAHVALPSLPARWPRCLHTRLVEKLIRSRATTVVFDVLFRERPPPSGTAIDFNAEQDIGLGSAMQRARQVLIAQKINAGGNEENQERLVALAQAIDNGALGAAPFPVVNSADKRFDQFLVFKESGWATPSLPILAVQAYTLDVYPMFRRLLHQLAPAHATYLPVDVEEIRNGGRLQATVLLIRQIFLADATLAQRMHQTLEKDSSASDSHAKAQIDSLIDLYSGEHVRFINFFGPAGTVRSIGFDQALGLSDDDAMSLFNGKAVFVGYSELGEAEQVEHFHTVYSTASGKDLSGVEIAATAFANLLHRTTITPAARPSWTAIAFGAGMIAAMLSLLLSYRASFPLVGILASAYGATVLFLFSRYAVWYPLVVPMFVAAPLGAGSGILWNYHIARRQRDRIRWAFTQFIPVDVVAALEKNAEPLGNAPELLECACVATDAANFTGLAETLSPEELAAFLNEYFEALFRPVAKYGGFVSDVVGDALLAIWPHRLPDTRMRVCNALLEMHDAARRFQERAASGGLATRIGVDWGRVALGTLGAHGHYEYRAVGDPVNTAHRIQDLNKQLGTQTLISRPTLEGTEGLLLRDAGLFLLRGKKLPVHLFELVGRLNDASTAQVRLCERFGEALHLLQTGPRSDAINALRAIVMEFPEDRLAAYYVRALDSGTSFRDGALIAV